MAPPLAPRQLVQSALDALAQHVAVLDGEGTIILVNEAWRRFGRENGLTTPYCCLGANYLAVCTRAAARGAPFAEAAAEGIRAVAQGQRPAFSLEYPCHAPAQARWFVMHVTRFESGGQVRMVVTHDNITARKRVEEALRESEQRFRIALANSPVVLFNQDQDLRYTWVHNPHLGFQAEHVLGRTDRELLAEEDAVRVEAIKRRVLATGRSERQEVGTSNAGAEVWYDLYVEPQHGSDGRIIGIACAAVDITERKRAQEAREFLMRELEHRLKNVMATVQSVVLQTVRTSRLPEPFAPALSEALSGRLATLGTVQALLTRGNWRGAMLDDLVREELAPYRSRERANIVSGSAVFLNSELVVALGMTLHELATNAAKYGALSVPEGWVEVLWQVEADGQHLALQWIEHDGPRVREPERRGFGCALIERSVNHGLGGTVRLEFPPTGVRCRIGVPLGPEERS